jgi:peptidoglycan hydrolase-like protein with peptidoglycan-binding domain
MTLKSELFRNDAALESAAASDPAHITKGARGDHVRKIQIALNRLDSAGLTTDGVYGAGTAGAVLAYKRKRDIVNRSFQTQADDIVGKMTMASLDDELVDEESVPELRSLHPRGRSSGSRPSRAANRPAFAVRPAAPGLETVANPLPAAKATNPGDHIEIIVRAPGGRGTIQVEKGVGGTLFRSQRMSHYGEAANPFQVAKLINAKTLDQKEEEADVTQLDQQFVYEAVQCGETFFQVLVETPGRPRRLSRIGRVLCLVEKASTRKAEAKETTTPASGALGALVSQSGLPLNPKDGRRINLFGEGETTILGAQWEEYASDIDFTSHGFNLGQMPSGTLGQRPWTNDPRSSVRIPSASVMNIFARSTPMKPVSIAEVLRIGRAGCRVTYSEFQGRRKIDQLTADLLGAGARKITEGKFSSDGLAAIFELA